MRPVYCITSQKYHNQDSNNLTYFNQRVISDDGTTDQPMRIANPVVGFPPTVTRWTKLLPLSLYYHYDTDFSKGMY